MSKNECLATIQACKLFIDEYEIDNTRNKNKCAKFFEVCKHIRMFLQLSAAILERIEKIESEMDEINQKIN